MAGIFSFFTLLVSSPFTLLGEATPLKLLRVSLRSKRSCSTEEIFRKLAARKLGQETEGTLARRPPIFEKPVRPRTGASDWCGTVTMIDRRQISTKMFLVISSVTKTMAEDEKGFESCVEAERIGSRFYIEKGTRTVNAPSL